MDEQTLRTAVAAIMRQNRRVTKDGFLYTVPSPDTYPYQWLWDSCFHATILSYFDINTAKDELRSLVSRQFDDGMIPHIIYWQDGTLHKYEWGKTGTSAITQPPLLAGTLWRIFQQDGDRDFLAELYPAVCKFYLYLIEKRDPRDHHLIAIINPDESGEDNSPRFDTAIGAGPTISLAEHLQKRIGLIEDNRKCNFDAELCMKKFFWVKDVPFNAILVENLRTLSHIASLLEREHDARIFTLHSELIAGAMREVLFQDGLFWPAAGPDHELLKVATWAHFAPLYAGLYSQEEARVLVQEHLLNEEIFWSPFGVRTVSKQEPSYGADAFWRGPIWMAPHWIIYKGLKRYGFTNEATLIREKSLTLLEKAGFREYFNPETGEGYGAHDFTWNGLLLDMQ